MSRINFCHVIDYSTPNPLLFTSLKYSDRERIDYEVIGLREDEGLGEQLGELGVGFRSLGYRSRKDAPAAFAGLYRHFRRTRTRVVQAHLFDAGLIGISAAAAARVPVRIVTGHHSHETPLHKRRFLTFADGASPRFFATDVIAPSRQMKQIFVEQLKVPERKVHVVHHGFDLAEWRGRATRGRELREEMGLAGKTVWLTLGRMFWVKNFENLIDAFAEVVKADRDSVLLIAGGGNSRELRQGIDNAGLTDEVKLLGARPDVPDLLRASDVMVHSALAESFGMVFIEALALGTPVVATPFGVAPEVIRDGECGFLSEGTDAASLASAMKNMLAARSDWPAMSQRAVEVSERFEIRKTQAECDRLYLKLLGVEV